MKAFIIIFLLAFLVNLGDVDGFTFKSQHRSISFPAPSIRTQSAFGRENHLESQFRSTTLSSDTRLSVLISATDTWSNVGAMAGAATAGQLLRSTVVGKTLGSPVTAMAISFTLASVGVLNPGGTAAAKTLQLLSLQLATPLVLLGADLRDCVSRCGPLLPSFLFAVVSTVIACLVGWCFSGKMLTAALGQDGLAIAAALMAKNIGGGLNYIAVARCLSASPLAVAAGLCVDNIFALIYFPITSALSSGLPDVVQAKKGEENDEHRELGGGDTSMEVQKVCSTLFVSSVLLSIGEKIGGPSGALPMCTLVTVLFASLAPRSLLVPLQRQAEVLGTCFLYLFFATAGAPGVQVAESVKASIVPLGVFLTFLYSIHGLILWGLNRLFKGNASVVPQRLLVASSAAIGGPATSVALAQANDWKSLLVPSLLVGNIGYAIATFCGLAYHQFLNTM